MRATKTLVAGIAAAVAFAFAASAGAHPGGGPGPGYAAQGGGAGHWGGPGGGFGRGNPVAASEGRLAYLKAELGITAAQEGAWSAFAANTRARAQDMQAHRDAMLEGSATTPERFEQRAQFMQQRVAAMGATAAAVKDLYAVLTPEQKAIADGLFAHGGPGRMGFGGGR